MKPEDILERFLKEHEAEHYDFTPEVDYKVSTGSLTLDSALDGGLGPGVHRLLGASEGGKTSCALSIAKSFLATVPKSRVVIIKAEGRLNKKMKDRSGLPFAPTYKEWKDGMVYVFKSNVYEVVADFIEELIKNNPEGYKFLFIIDSLDGLSLRDDLAKNLNKGENAKMMGAPGISKHMLKRNSLPMIELGHMMLMISQIVSKPDNKYEKRDQMDTGGSGGNAVIHFANWILRFLPRRNADLILKGNEKTVDKDFDTSNIIGHNCRVELAKSDNEQTGKIVSYPIKHHAKKDSIWTEFELEKFLMSWTFLKKKGAWYELSENALKFMKDGAPQFDVPPIKQWKVEKDGVEELVFEKPKKEKGATVTEVPYVPEKTNMQGKATVIDFLSAERVRNFWFLYFRNFLASDDIF